MLILKRQKHFNYSQTLNMKFRFVKSKKSMNYISYDFLSIACCYGTSNIFLGWRRAPVLSSYLIRVKAFSKALTNIISFYFFENRSSNFYVNKFLIIIKSNLSVRFHIRVLRISHRTWNGRDLEKAQKGCRICHGTWRHIHKILR